MARKKKSRRKVFDRRKGFQKNITPTVSLDDVPTTLFLDLKDQVANIVGWTISDSQIHQIQLCQLCSIPSGAPTIRYSIVITNDLMWNIYVKDTLVEKNNHTLKHLPEQIVDFGMVKEITTILNSSSVCAGKCDEIFVALVKSRGGKMLDKAGKIVAYIDTALAPLCQDCLVSTVRTIGCELLCAKKQPNSRCLSCSKYRNQLRLLKSREYHGNKDSKCAESSHTNYRYLSNSELVLHLKNVHEHNTTKLTLRTKALQKKVMDCIESDGIILSEVESTDIKNVMELHTSNGTDLESNMFQKLLWEQQKLYNALNRKRQMKWHPLIIRFALSLHYASRSAYSFVAESGFLSLPFRKNTARLYPLV